MESTKVKNHLFGRNWLRSPWQETPMMELKPLMKVYFIGVGNHNSSSTKVERYDPSTNQWETLDSMSTKRVGPSYRP